MDEAREATSSSTSSPPSSPRSSHWPRSPKSPDIEEIVQLAPDEEMLIKIPIDAKVSSKALQFTLLDGEADVLGTNLREGKVYSFGPGSTFSILAHEKGCTVSFIKCHRFVLRTVEPATTGTTNKMLRRVASQIEDLACIAESEDRMGPIVCLAGPVDSGKSTACVALVNYAVQKGRWPFYVDVDLGQGKLSVPGTFGAVVADAAVEMAGNFSHLRKHAINYFVGTKSPGDCVAHHNLIASAFAKAIREKMEAHPDVKYSGMIINSCGWVEGPGYKILRHILEVFQADHVLVMGNEPPRLLEKLNEDFSPDRLSIIQIPRSELIIEKTFAFRKGARAARVHEYFNSNPGIQDELASAPDPSTFKTSFEVQLSDVKIYKLSSTKAPTASSALCPVTPSRALLNQLMAVSTLEEVDNHNHNQLPALSLSGYVSAIKINQIRGTLTLLAPPNQTPFKTALLLLSEIPLIERTK